MHILANSTPISLPQNHKFYEELFPENSLNFHFNFCLKSAVECLPKFENLYSRFDAIIQLAEIYGEVDLQKIKQFALTYLKGGEQAIGFGKIGRIDPEHDFTEAKKFAEALSDSNFHSLQSHALYYISTFEAEFYPTQAKITALSIQSLSFRSHALLNVIENEVKHDPIQARKTVQSIEKRFDKVRALIFIEERDPQHDFTSAKKNAMEGSETINTDQLMYLISRAELQFSLVNSKKTAESISSIGFKEMAALNIAEFEIRVDLEKAIQNVQFNQNPVFQTKFFLLVAKVDREFGLKKAKEFAKKIDEFSYHDKFWVYIELAELDPEYGFRNARKIANKYPLGNYEKHINGYATKYALKSSKLIDWNDFDQVLAERSRIEAKENLMQGIESAKKIRKAVVRFSAFLELAKVSKKKM